MEGIGVMADRLRRSAVSIFAKGRGSGSGVIWDASGLIVTNAHVVRGKDAVVELWTGRRYAATLAGQDNRRDLATLRVQAPPDELPAAEVARSESLRPGEIVIAVGNPLGFQGAVSRGLFQAVGPVRGLGGQAWVQADIRLAPGNSGGPLANAEGHVVGINSMTANGLGLAVPSEAVNRFLRYGSGEVSLGIAVQPARMRSGLGLVVLDVTDNSPAARASLMLGDVITGVGGKTLSSFDDLRAAIDSGAPRLALRFRRGDRLREREVTVQLRSGEAA